MKKLPEIPKSWLIFILLCGLLILAYLKIDSYITAGLSLLIGYLTGVKLEQTRKK